MSNEDFEGKFLSLAQGLLSEAPPSPLQSSLQVPPLGTAHRTRRRVQRLHDAHHPPARICL